MEKGIVLYIGCHQISLYSSNTKKSDMSVQLTENVLNELCKYYDKMFALWWTTLPLECIYYTFLLPYC